MAFLKTEMRREKAARMEVSALFQDVEIAEEVGLTLAGYQQMKRTPEYRELVTALKTGILSSLDKNSAEDIKALRQKIRENVPAAINTIIDLAQQRSDRKLALQASETLLEIDGHFSKVTRVGLPLEEQGGVGASAHEDNMAQAMLKALEKRKQKVTIETEPASDAVN